VLINIFQLFDRVPWHRLTHFDSKLRELRRTAVVMAAVLATYGSALLVEHYAGLHLDIVIQAIVLAMTLARAQRSAGTGDRLVGLILLPAVAVAGYEVSRLMSSHPDIGDVLFGLGLCTAVWMRRFGRRAARAGALIISPFVAILIVHAQGELTAFMAGPLWVALIALIACWWVAAFQLTAAHIGLIERPREVSRVPPRPGARPRRISASSQMALQLGAALAAAFVVGRTLWPEHWPWVVLTAFIVCSGARGRGDVVLKGVLRGGGAAVGTVVATLIAGSFGPRADATIVVIFVALALATWLREFSYAFWAAFVTAVISLLYGWFGEGADGLLQTRLEGIAVGAVLGITASWLILPVRTRDVLRRRSADALHVLAGIIGADWTDTTRLRRLQAAFDQRVELADQIGRPLRARRLLAIRRRGVPHQADAIDALQRCAGHVHSMVEAASNDGGTKDDPCVASLAGDVAANVAAVGRAIGRRDGAPYRPAATPAACPAAPASPPAARVPDPPQAEAGVAEEAEAAEARVVPETGGTREAAGTPGTDSPSHQVVTALTVIDGALGELWGVFFSPVTAGQPSGDADEHAAAPVP
jgi:Fusaric acid resistance protein-like